MAATEVATHSRWVALGFASLSQLCNAMATQMCGPLAPLFQPELGITKAQVGMFTSAVFAGTWGMLLIAGSLTDRFGVRTMMALGQMVAGAVLLFMVLVGSFLQAVVVMFVVGIGRAAVNPGGSKAVMDWFPANLRATAMGINQAGFPLAGILTASLLPAFALTHGWRVAFAVVGLVIIADGVVTAVGYPSPPRQARVRKAGPRGDLREVLSNRYLWMVSTIVLLLVSVQLSTVTYLALYFKETVLVTAMPEESARIVAAGSFLAFCQVGGVLGRIGWGLLSDRVFHGRRMAVMAAIAALTAAMCTVVACLGTDDPLWLLAAIVFALGATAVAYNGLYHTLIVESAGAGRVATAVGLSMTVMSVGTIGGPPLFGFIVDLSGSYRMGWLFLAGLAAVGTLFAAAGARSEKRSFA